MSTTVFDLADISKAYRDGAADALSALAEAMVSSATESLTAREIEGLASLLVAQLVKAQTAFLAGVQVARS